MGRKKKGFNWKARQTIEGDVDDQPETEPGIKISIKGLNQDKYDEANALVLPSKRNLKRPLHASEPVVKKLSKKQRKKLEKVVERKHKKTRRAELLEALQKVQVDESERAMLISTTDVYSGKTIKKNKVISEDFKEKISSIGGLNKKRRLQSASSELAATESDSSMATSDESTDEEEDAEAIEDTKRSDDEMSSHEKETNDVAESSAACDVSIETCDRGKKVKPVETPSQQNREAAVFIPVDRSKDIQDARLQLPILAEEQSIMEAIHDNPVVVICGETGSGKTTQLPQFLYEAGYAHGEGIIGVTEPRRVAAISMSQRVGIEMNLSSKEVSYQIRYEGNVTNETKIKFMTDGVLLKEVQKDFLLRKYKVIIIDEAHERSVYTDILIGLLSRIVPLRHKRGKPLKLIIMSATLRVEDFTANDRLFTPAPPVIKVDSRQYPVSIHFNKRTPFNDYLSEAYKKICKIHQQLPEGGILVFLTSQQEIHSLCSKLKMTYPSSGKNNNKESEIEDGRKGSKKRRLALPKISLDDYSILPADEEAELQLDADEEDYGLAQEDDLEDTLGNSEESVASPLHVLPLYSLLATDKQAKVFEPPPEGSRLCVLATNVAETSITIPNIKYVVDTGKVKTKLYDKVTGVSTFKVSWTSQASANQRAGRAGRTGPGHCYRLYSSAVFNDEFDKFSPPEIQQRPVDDLVLQMKDIGIEKVVNFPFPTAPDEEALKAAEKLLLSLGALEKPLDTRPRMKNKIQAVSGSITPVGRAMASFPVSPRYGKMLALGQQHGLLPYVVAMVAALSVQELFQEISTLPSEDEESSTEKKRSKLAATKRMWAGSGNSMLLGDLMVLLKAVGSCEFAGFSTDFCTKHGIRYKAMSEVRKLRAQLTNALNVVIPEANLILDPKMAPPNDAQAKLLRQIVLAGMGDHVARRMPDVSITGEDAKKMKNAFQSMVLEDAVFVHPSSVLFKNKDIQYVVYQSIDETSKLYMKGVTAIEPEWLPLFVDYRCSFSKPLEKPEPRYDAQLDTIVCHRSSTFGPHFWSLPAVEVDYPDDLNKIRWFARYLLDGAVIEKLGKFVPTLLCAPSTMVKSWAKLQARTDTILKALAGKEVSSKESLLRAWKTNPKYLLNAFKEWIPEVQHAELENMWPPSL